MRKLIIAYMDTEDAVLQIKDLKENGVDYDISRKDYNCLTRIAPNISPPIPVSKQLDEDFVSLNEQHFNWFFQVLQIILKKYISQFIYMQKIGSYDFAVLEKIWLDVGFVQRFLSVSFVNAYCSNQIFINPIYDLDKIDLPRETKYHSWIKNSYEDWFDDALSTSKLGKEFGIYKGGGRGHSVTGRSWGGWGNLCELDLAKLLAFYEARYLDFIVLIDEYSLKKFSYSLPS